MENFDVVDSVLFMPILCCFRAVISAVKRHYKQNDFYSIYHQRHSNYFLQMLTLFVYFSVENAQFWNKYLHLALLFMRYWPILPFFTKEMPLKRLRDVLLRQYAGYFELTVILCMPGGYFTRQHRSKSIEPCRLYKLHYVNI